MKKLKWIFALILLLGILMYVVIQYPIHKDIVTVKKSEYSLLNISEGMKGYMDAIALLESNNRYSIPKSTGQYWGRYQLGLTARKCAGVQFLTLYEFQKDSIIQDYAMYLYTMDNLRLLKPTIDKYKIPYYGGVLINNNLVTVSGLLGMAHLVGYRNAKKFIETGKIAEDGNKIKCLKYLQLNNFKI